MTTRGRFITLEGGEGAGKSTQARFVRDWLSEYGHDVVLTREPGGSPLAEAIRGVVLGDWAEGVTPPTEVLLMFAARAAHWHTTIAPALAAGRDVVCDRFVDSSYAYQGAGKGVSATALKALEKLAIDGCRPDLTLLLDIDPEEGLHRARARGEVREDVTPLFADIPGSVIFSRRLIAGEPVDHEFLVELVDDVLLPLASKKDLS